MPGENQPLLDFIESAKSHGASDEFVAALLRQNGWSERRIYQAFGLWYEARTGKAVPSGGGRIEAAKDAFLYLLAFITLGIWTIPLGALLFTVIDRAFPNPAIDYANATMIDWVMAYELAGILVGLPVFLAVTWRIVRDVQRQPERLESPVRKWLTYIALVLTASTMIGDVVTFLAYFLRGDLDTRFILKTLTILVIAGGVFAYYLDSLRPGKISSSRNRLFSAVALVVAGFGVVVGFTETGSPRVQRLSSEDARRLSDLSSIAQSIHLQWISRGQAQFTLPATIDKISRAGVAAGSATVDPVTGKEYEYRPSQGMTYVLCANFSRSSDAGVPPQWRHPAGHACFALGAKDNVSIVLRRF